MLPVPCLLELQDFMMGNTTFEVIQDSRNLTLVRTRRGVQQRLIIPDLHTESDMKPRWAAKTLSQWKGMKGRGTRRQRGYTKHALCRFPLTHTGFFFFCTCCFHSNTKLFKGSLQKERGERGCGGLRRCNSFFASFSLPQYL